MNPRNTEQEPARGSCSTRSVGLSIEEPLSGAEIDLFISRLGSTPHLGHEQYDDVRKALQNAKNSILASHARNVVGASDSLRTVAAGS